MNLNVSSINHAQPLYVSVNQSTNESVGSCTFMGSSDPTSSVGFSYKVRFSHAIDSSSFDVSDISNLGTGGATTLTWSLTNCGDDTNFELTATSITGSGTIIPVLAPGTVYDMAGNQNLTTTATDNSVTFDTIGPLIVINKAVTETVGSCNFTAVTDPTRIPGFSYKITFSEVITVSSFTTADITNGGTGGVTTLSWVLADCGDNRNFKLTATAVSGNGTIVPNVAPGVVQDLAGNTNSLSTSTDNTYTFNGGWFQEAYIKAANNNNTDNFGHYVSLHGDTLAVSTPAEDSNETTITNGTSASSNNSNSMSGAVYVYKRTGSTWAQEAYIKAVNNDANDYFGISVTLNGDTLAVGSYQEDSNQSTITNGATASSNNSNSLSGAVYVYRRTGVTWAQEAYIKAVNNDVGDIFGRSVSISGDTLAVSAQQERSNQNTITNGPTASSNNSNIYAGAVYVYKRTGVAWAQEAYIKASNNDPNDFFGFNLSLQRDTLAVGVYAEDSNQTTITNGTTASSDNSKADSGAVYVYKRTGVAWAQEAYIKAVNGDTLDYFGTIVSVSENTLAVGSDYEDSNLSTITNGTSASNDNTNTNSGAVYVYKRTGVSWAQEAYIKAVNNDANDHFGENVSLSGDTLAVGAPQESSNQTTITNGPTASNDDSSLSSGAVYVYKRTGAVWAQEAYIKAANSGANDLFGSNISLSGDTLAVGAYQESSNQTTITNGSTASSDNTNTGSGAVYVYRNISRLFDVVDLRATATSNSVTLTWTRTGGNATGYYLAYSVGSTPPVNCQSDVEVNLLNVANHTEAPLSSGTIYSFRVCATDGTLFTNGATVTISTL